VFPGAFEGKPDTYVVTGDIDAMWLRDSSAQLWPYLPLAKQDAPLRELLDGVIRRQARMILLDPYANAFMRDSAAAPLSWAVKDNTDHHPGVGERKWEVDSLCYTIRLAHGYWRQTGDTKPFDARWKEAAWTIVRTFREQQRKQGQGPYKFQRESAVPSDTLQLGGFGNPARPVGMIFSMFRPSDDACIYPLFVPANLFAVLSLHQLAEMAAEILHDAKLAQEATALATEVEHALNLYGKVQHPKFGEIWAYEVDGYGNALMMDDAGAPGLLSLPYLGCCRADDPLYMRTRSFVHSQSNPYFISGKAAEAVGSPHVGLTWIWPMSILYRALTTADEREIRQSLRWLRDTTAGTGFIHESFDKDDPSKFTRSWFAWANTLFGELVVNLAKERPALLAASLG
jgi:meiotically up-regulated gene 157 (Mug157) protein